MDDDIDIEEHDVLDNPAIKTIFPDLTVLKQEVLCDYDEVVMEKKYIDYENIQNSDNLENKATPSSFHCVSSEYKNILSAQLLETDVNDLKNVPVINNKIILGSKPTKATSCRINYNSDEKLYQSVRVTVKNIMPYLHGCEKYCKTCFILFPFKEAFESHVQLFHRQFSNNLFLNNSSFGGETEQPEKNTQIKCLICDKTFASLSGLYKHRRNIHVLETKSRKKHFINKTKSIAQRSPIKKINEKIMHKQTSAVFCFHCDNSFSNMESLIEHLYDKLQTKKSANGTCNEKDNHSAHKHSKQDVHSNSMIPQKQDEVDSSEDRSRLSSLKNRIDIKEPKMLVYRCPICSYYFTNSKFCSIHLLTKHNITNKSSLKKVLYHPKCKFCSFEYKTIRSYNCHICKAHKKKLLYVIKTKKKSLQLPECVKEVDKIMESNENNIKLMTTQQETNKVSPSILSCKENPLDGILKSAIFRCNRCDIHFLHSQVAVDHLSHMEILINWKCSLCNRIFKKNDELFHMQQHLVTTDFEVYGISETTPSLILYYCPKCTVHFSENTFLQHFPLCDTESLNNVRCEFCGILIDSNLESIHNNQHKRRLHNSASFIIVKTEVIKKNSINADLWSKEHRQLRNRDIKVDYNLDSHKLNMCEVYYCKTCKCFVNRGKTFMTHKRSCCKHVIPTTCKLCGLVIPKTYISSHARIHQRKANLSLNDFKFYDLHSEQLINPPIPEFHHCNVCEIYFPKLIGKMRHRCGAEDYVTCTKCNLKFIELGHKLHMHYHNYSLSDRKAELKKTITNFVKKRNIEIKENGLTKPSGSNLEEKEQFIIYMCKNCHISVDSYDLMIEHCQGHYNSIKISSRTHICNVCHLIFNTECYNNHKAIHVRSKNKNEFKIVKFDIFSFKSNYDEWIKTVFNTLPQDEVRTIIDRSIYKYENRIKMKVIQKGSHELTLYKCDKCGCFIEPKSLITHLKNDCSTLRKHTCTICKIPFVSVGFKLQHEEVHKQPFNGVKSYRIVLFNRAEDEVSNNTLNSVNSFTLHKCRNCDGIVNKLDYNNHICNKNDLRKCTFCGLLIYDKDFIFHISKHKEFDSFNSNNIKVILIGKTNENEDSTMKGDYVKSTFKGKVFDYLFYRCKKCQVCLANKKSSFKHECFLKIAKTKCSLCGIYLTAKDMKNHNVLHETDCSFSIDNITFIDFDNSESKNNCYLRRGTRNNIAKNNDADVILLTEDVKSENASSSIQKLINLYKCQCGLHFLNNLSASNHRVVCNSKTRTPRQNCSKCGLTFSPGVLFCHLLQHHGKKNIVCQFNIIDVFH